MLALPWRTGSRGSEIVGRSAVRAIFARPFTENGSDDDMKQECVHQHSRFAIRWRIASAFSENHAFANDHPKSRMFPISHWTSQRETVPSGFKTPETVPA